jgi:hypothetical protein
LRKPAPNAVQVEEIQTVSNSLHRISPPEAGRPEFSMSREDYENFEVVKMSEL